MESGQRRGGVRRLFSALRSEWTELSGLGRVALLGMLLSAAIVVALGFYIPAAARSQLIDSRAELLERVVANLSDRGLVPATGSDTDSLVALDEAVRLRLLGGEAVRVKVWSPDGTIVYSDAKPLIGRTFPLGDHELAALQGETSVSVADRVLQLVADGLENKQIARRLAVSESTVKTHLRSIFSRLDVTSRAEAVANAARFGLIE